MINSIQRVKQHFSDSIQIKTKARDELSPIIAKAGEVLVQCLKQGHKILTCGNGGSACDAQHFVCELVNRFEKERQELAAVSLLLDAATSSAIANDHFFDEVFSKPLKALGQSGDVLLAITTSGNSKNVLKAVEVAHKKSIPVIALTGKDGGALASLLQSTDIEIRVSEQRTMRIQEVHLLIIHCLCDLIDQYY